VSDDFPLDDDLHYEDFDDEPYAEPDDLDAIDLDAADEAATAAPPSETPPVPPPPVAPHPRPHPPAGEPPRRTPPPEHIARPPAPTPHDEPTPPRAARVEVPEEAEAFAADIVREAEPTSAEYPALPVEEAAPEPADLIACVVLALPPDFAAEIEGLRAAAGLAALPPGVVLAGSLRVPDRAALEDALDGWARAHLPLPLETAGVVAEVVGAQRYVAAWALQPADRLRRLCTTLHAALAPRVEPAENAPPPAATVRLVVGDYVPAEHYPRLVARMQRAFAPQAWLASTLGLAQRDASDPASAWEVVWVSA